MHSNPKNYSQFQPEERVTLASLKQQNYSIRAMARVLERPVSTISRELRRNSAQDQYASVPAQHSCHQRRSQSRPPAKLHIDSIVFGLVQHFLQLRWSPAQIALKLASRVPARRAVG
jgi:IS30 family transposase